MPDSVFIKEIENGVATETRSIPDSQAEEWVLDRFQKEKTKKFVVDGDAPTEKELSVEKTESEPVLESETPVSITKKEIESVKRNSNKKSTEKYDFVESPNHYNGHTIIVKGGDEFGYETIEFIESWLRRHAWMPEEAKYAFGNALKYLDRIGDKPEEGKTREEKAAEDSAKIGWFINRATKALKGHSELYGKK